MKKKLPFVVLLGCFLSTSVFAETSRVGFIAEESIKGRLMAGQHGQMLGGRVSLYLEASEEELEKGIVHVKDINLLLPQVDQEKLSGKKPKGKQLAALGLSLAQTLGRSQSLKYDSQKKELVGELLASSDFPQISELVKPLGPKEDFQAIPTQRSVIKFSLSLPQGLRVKPGDSVQRLVTGPMKLAIDTQALGDLGLRQHRLDLTTAAINFNYVILARFEVGKKLCIQPVKIRSSVSDGAPTGAGLAFGLPGARTEWDKADITFQVREWKTVTSSTLKVADNATEEGQIRTSIQDDDCVEVFFVEDFVPVDLHGGGATWGGGTASAQIISSDANVGTVNLTHLAHELGHVVGLHHPGAGAPNASFPALTDASTGTLMCPSGFYADNPTTNSQFNKEHASNPLLTFSFKLRGAAVDCTNSADCGSCP